MVVSPYKPSNFFNFHEDDTRLLEELLQGADNEVVSALSDSDSVGFEEDFFEPEALLPEELYRDYETPPVGVTAGQKRSYFEAFEGESCDTQVKAKKNYRLWEDWEKKRFEDITAQMETISHTEVFRKYNEGLKESDQRTYGSISSKCKKMMRSSGDSSPHPRIKFTDIEAPEVPNQQRKMDIEVPKVVHRPRKDVSKYHRLENTKEVQDKIRELLPEFTVRTSLSRKKSDWERLSQKLAQDLKTEGMVDPDDVRRIWNTTFESRCFDYSDDIEQNEEVLRMVKPSIPKTSQSRKKSDSARLFQELAQDLKTEKMIGPDDVVRRIWNTTFVSKCFDYSEEDIKQNEEDLRVKPSTSFFVDYSDRPLPYKFKETEEIKEEIMRLVPRCTDENDQRISWVNLAKLLAKRMGITLEDGRDIKDQIDLPDLRVIWLRAKKHMKT